MQTGADGDTGSDDTTLVKKPVVSTLAAIGLIVLLAAAAMGAGTMIGPTGANFTSGDLSGVGNIDASSQDAVADHFVTTDDELDTALQEAAKASTDEITIKLASGTYQPSVSLPVDITNTSVRFIGTFPRSTYEYRDPDLFMEPGGGTILDCQGADGLFTGNHIRGSQFENFWAENCDGAVLSFGEKDKTGMYFSTIKNVYAYNVSEFLNLTNIQHVYGEHIKARSAHRVLDIANDHTDHDGANSVFVDPYLYGKSNDDGDKVDGGIRFRALTSGDTLNYVTLIRPQVNMFNGAKYTGSAITAVGKNGAQVNSISILGADLEGKVYNGLKAGALKQSNINIENGGSVNYTVNLSDSGGQISQQNVVRIANPTQGKVKSETGENTIMGTTHGVEGTMTRFGFDTKAGEAQLVVGDISTHSTELDINSVVDMNGNILKNIDGNIDMSNGGITLNNGALTAVDSSSNEAKYKGNDINFLDNGNSFINQAGGGNLWIRTNNAGGSKTGRIIIGGGTDQPDIDVQNADLNMNGNPVKNANKTNYNAGTEPACDGTTEGDIRYNGTHHVGCDGNTWNALY